MRPTSRFRHVVAASAVLAGLGVLAQQPAAVLGSLGLASWLVVSQFTATREFQRATDRLDVSVDPVRNTVIVEEELSVTVEASLSAPARADVEITVDLPAGATVTDGMVPTLVLDAGETRAATTFSCSFPTAGEFDFPAATVTLENSQRTVGETVPVTPEEQIRVDPRQPRNLHVGQGGDRVAAYGEHPAGSGAAGLVPEEVRQYVPGDALDRIDWKATARLQSPHVREFEAETDRKTVVAIDHSDAMDLGPDGQTMLDYAREVAIGYARAAESFDDPLGLFGIGDEGITVRQDPTSSPVGYRYIRNALHDIESTRSETAARQGGDRLTRPSDARVAANQLAEGESAFASAVGPFLADTEAYVHRIEEDPLFETVRRIVAETSGEIWLVLLTTDTGRNRIRDAVSLVSGHGGNVSLFLTPRPLFEPGAMDDLTEAYERYASFESFRRTVNRIPRTEVYEVGPGDRLDALLAARRRAKQ